METKTLENTALPIREYRDSDKDEVVSVWHRSGRAAYTYLPTWQALSLKSAEWVFENIIQQHSSIWVGLKDGHVVAYLAMKGSYIDRLYVDPDEWHKGWGTRLVNFAKEISPTGLELHTHQANTGARELYERLGFEAVSFGTSPAPESAPDVEYHWRP